MKYLEMRVIFFQVCVNSYFMINVVVENIKILVKNRKVKLSFFFIVLKNISSTKFTSKNIAMKKITQNFVDFTSKNTRMATSFLVLFLFVFASNASAQNVTVNPGGGSYADLTSAFAAINAGTHTGDVTISIVGNTTELASAVLNASGTGSANYTSVAIFPSGARTITGAITGHLIDLNGADNVTINGLNSDGNSLSISNTAAGASSTVRFINDASSNSIKNTTFQGSTTSFGVVYFATGTSTGNDGNNVNNCTITAAGANFPINGIYSLGTSAVIDNSGNTINANSISDFFSAGSATVGININSFNSTWTITNNKLFQTASRTYTTANTHTVIGVGSGDGYTITGNTIGYASAAGTGVYTMTGTIATRLIGINLAVGTATASSVQGNTITAISLNTSSGAATTNGILCGINITAGNVNVGNVTANTIGASSGVDALKATPTTALGTVVGINCSSTGTIVIQNNVIGGLTSSGTTAAVSGSINGINVSGVATSINISNNTIGNATANNMRGGTLGLTTGSSLVVGINLVSTPTTAILNNNTISNLSSYGTGTSGCVRGIQTATTSSLTTTGWTINNNTISNLTTNNTFVGTTSGLVSAQGIHHGSSIGSTISQNTISNISNFNATATTNIVVAGIGSANSALTTAFGTSITRNKIFGLSNLSVGTTASTPSVIAGVLVRSGNAVTTIANNMISLGNAQSTNTTIIGIWSNNASAPDPSATNIYHNTVTIEGTVASGALSTFCYNRGDLTTAARTVTIDLRNNIFNNSRSGGTGQHFALANNFGATASATGWGANASNYNVLNAASGTIGYWTSAQTFSGWKTASASDANSLSAVSVPFENSATGDLHMSYGTTPTQLESGGTTISGISTDFDNQTRPGPSGSVNGGGVICDIGADEFDAVPLDFVSPVIVYTPLSTSCAAGARTLTATIADVSGVPQSGAGLPVAYFKINSGAYTAVTGTWVSGNTYTFSIGTGSVTGDVISYYIVAQDNAGTPNIGAFPSVGAAGFTANPAAAATPPTTPNTYTSSTTLSGTYTVGAGGAYPTLTAAVAALNTSCISGTVTLSLTDATYAAETFPITINSLLGSGSLIIKPTGTTTISGSSATALLLINGADNVTIDGSSSTTENSLCPLTSASRNLTFTNTNAVTTAAVIWLATTAAFDPATNCTVKNCIISGASASTTIVGLGAGGPTIGNGGTNNDNISFINNDIRACQFGIYSAGANATYKNQNITVNQNFINTAAPNNLGQGGIYLAYTNNVTVSGNTVGNVISSLNNVDPVAINVGFAAVNGFNTTTTGLADGASNVTITNNTIGTIIHSNTYSVVGIALGNTISGTSLIANNMIYGVTGNVTAGDFSAGIVLGGGTAPVNVYHNTVSMQGTISGATLADQTSACLAITSATPSPVNMRNNIFTNTQIGNTGATIRFRTIALRYSSTLGNYESLVSTNNSLYAAGAGPGTYGIGITGGVVTGTSRTALADWRTETGRDLNSSNVLPVFTSGTDLHLNTSNSSNVTNFGATGAALAGAVAKDFDCDIRNPLTPDLGADQFNLCTSPTFTTCPGAQTANTANNACTAVVTYTTAVAGTSPTITYVLTGATTGSGSGDASGLAFNKGTTTVTLTVSNYCGNASCSFTVVVTDTVNPTITAPTAVAFCIGNPVSLGTPITADNCAVASTINNAPSSFPLGTTVVTWTVTDSSGNSATATQDVTINALPTVGASVSPSDTVLFGTPVTLNGTGATSYSWSGGVTDGIAFSPASTATYTVTGTDGNGCSNTATQTVNVYYNYTVTFDNNSGSGVMANQVTSAPAALTSNTFTKLGYHFIGWNTVANGSGTAYADGATYSFAADITMYAQWELDNEATNFEPRNYDCGQFELKFMDNSGTLTQAAAESYLTCSSNGGSFVRDFYPGMVEPGMFSFFEVHMRDLIPGYTYTFTFAQPGYPVKTFSFTYGTVTGSNEVCIGASTPFNWDGSTNNASPWYSSNPSVATVNPVTGVVTGVSAGVATIYYNTFWGGFDDGYPCNKTIIVNALPSVGASVSPSSTVAYGTPVTLNGTGATSYSWSGGVTDGIAFSPASTATYTVTGTDGNGCSNTATQTVNVYYNYTVTFDNNSGSGVMANQVASAPTALTTNTFTKANYSFAGWNTAANGSGTDYADGVIYSFAADVTLYAQWLIDNHTVTFDNNTGSGVMTSQVASAPAALTSNTFTKVGFNFTGWNTEANGSGTAYADAATYAFDTDVTLYAQWAANNYTVTFDNNTGSGVMANQLASAPTALSSNTFTKANYHFTGWNTAADGSGTAYADGASYSFAANVTLYAQWAIDVVYTSIAAASCGATLSSMGSLVYADINLNATAYRFKVVNNNTGDIQYVDNTHQWFALNWLASYDYATAYTVSVQLQIAGVWVGYYGTSCVVNSPSITSPGGSLQLISTQCGATLPSIATVIYTTAQSGATGYRFRITDVTPNATGDNLVQEKERSYHWFGLTMLTRYNYGSTYMVEVAVKTTGGYTGYGSPCYVNTPASPMLNSCGAVIPTSRTLVYTAITKSVSQYRFQVTKVSDQSSRTFDTSRFWFSFKVNVPGYTPSVAYSVRVAVMTAGTWSPFGDACEITSPAIPRTDGDAELDFAANVFPNPYTDQFNLLVNTDSDERISYKVYDMLGKLIEADEFDYTALETKEFGRNYPAGVYNIIVTQGEERKTLRIIKR